MSERESVGHGSVLSGGSLLPRDESHHKSPLLMTSRKPNYLPKFPPINFMLGVRASTSKFGGT